VTFLCDSPVEGSILILDHIVIDIQPISSLLPEISHFYCLIFPISLPKGFTTISWDFSVTKKTQSSKKTPSSPKFIFPGFLQQNFELTPQGPYLPHDDLPSYPFAETEIAPSLIRIHASDSPPLLFHSSLLATGSRIQDYPALSRGDVGRKRQISYIYFYLT